MRKRFAIQASLLLVLLRAGAGAEPDELRQRIKETFFVPEPMPEVSPATYGRFEPEPGVFAERITYGTEYGMRVPAILYLPKSPSGKIPAFIVVNGHGGDKYSWYAYYTGILYARAGAAVLTYDPVGEGERNAEHKSDARAHDALKPDPVLARHLAGLMMTDVLQAVSYLLQRPEIDPTRISALGFSMGSFVLAVTCAVDTRLNTCVLAGGGNLDGPGERWDTSHPVCQGLPYRSLMFLGDRPAEIYKLHALRGPTLIINGLKDNVLLPQKHEPHAFFDDLKQRVNMPGKVFDTVFIPDGGHRPYFVTRPAALWIESKVHFPNWTESSIRSMPETHILDWAKEHGVSGGTVDNELGEGGTLALASSVPAIAHDRLNVLSPADWQRNKDTMILERWVQYVSQIRRLPAARP